jgi:hypothetical protein
MTGTDIRNHINLYQRWIERIRRSGGSKYPIPIVLLWYMIVIIIITVVVVLIVIIGNGSSFSIGNRLYRETG